MVVVVVGQFVMSEKTQTEERKASVSEDKFNGTATLTITADCERDAKYAARKYFEEIHGSSPSKVIVSERNAVANLFGDGGGCKEFEVMVSDHSSGSLADSKEYEF